MSEGRQAGGFGPCPLGWGDMAAWASLTGTPLLPWHARVLRAMDVAYMAALAKAEKK